MTATKPKSDPQLTPEYAEFEKCARAGYAVIPLRGKRPVDAGWTKRAYPKSDTLRRIRHGRLNAGFRIPPNVIVLDPDGEEGGDSYFRLCLDTGFDDKPFHRTTTGGGGQHVIMAVPPGFKAVGNLSKRGYPKIDVKQNGGQIVAPGSVHPNTGRLYRWQDDSPRWDTPLRMAPASLLAVLSAASTEAANDNNPDPERAKRLLNSLDATKFSDYDEWLRVSLAFKAEGGRREDWQDWNETDPSYDNDESRAENEAKWETFEEEGAITGRTLEWYVKEAGHADVLAQEDFVDDAEEFDDGFDDERRKLRKRFKAWKFSELRNSPRPTYLVDRLLPANCLFEIYGRPKSGKTFFTLAMALCIATGVEFYDMKTEPGRVLYIIGEGNRKAFEFRMEAWIIANAKGKAERERLESLIERNFMTLPLPMHVDVKGEVSEFIKANPGTWSLIVVDTLMRNMVGHISDPKDMTAFVMGCDFIREKTGAAVLVVHHEGKDKTKGGMGSIAMDAHIDGLGHVERRGDKRIFSLVLLRDGADDMPSMVFALDSIPVVTDLDDESNNVRSAVLRLVDRKAKEDRRMTADARVLMFVYERKPKKQSDIAAGLGMDKGNVSKAITALRKEGYLTENGLSVTPAGQEYFELLNDADDAE